jgi:hypothetical protein
VKAVYSKCRDVIKNLLLSFQNCEDILRLVHTFVCFNLALVYVGYIVCRSPIYHT